MDFKVILCFVTVLNLGSVDTTGIKCSCFVDKLDRCRDTAEYRAVKKKIAALEEGEYPEKYALLKCKMHKSYWACAQILIEDFEIIDKCELHERTERLLKTVEKHGCGACALEFSSLLIVSLVPLNFLVCR